MLSELADGEVGEVASVLAEQHLVDAAEITRLEVEVTEQKHELGAQAEALRLRRAQTLQEQARIHELTSENRKLKSALSADELARSAEMIAELQAENEELIEQLGLSGGKDSLSLLHLLVCMSLWGASGFSTDRSAAASNFEWTKTGEGAFLGLF